MNRQRPSLAIGRRQLLAAAPVALGTFLLDPRPGTASEGQIAGVESPSTLLPSSFPAQEAEAVRSVVGASHGNFERVKELVDERPELAKAAWDWGFGDWESALGAASHTGNREIAEYLIAHGARPNLFSAAMLGDLPTVKAFVAAIPGIESQPGPHGLPLLLHARFGGEPAAEVFSYLEKLGTADPHPDAIDLPLERSAYLGSYTFGTGPDDRFEVLDRRERLMFQRSDGTPRGLWHSGKNRFHPAGAPSVEIRFVTDGLEVRALELYNPRRIVRAIKTKS